MIYNDKEYKIINCTNPDKRSRYWCCEWYSDSGHPDYQSLIKSMGVRAAVSPLHNNDYFIDGEKKGQLKKPHRHILFNFKSGYRLSDFVPIVDTIGGVTHVQIVRDVAIMHDYLCHLHEIDKTKYDPKDVIYINSTRYDYVNSEFKEILNFIDDNKISGFRQLTKKLRWDDQDKLLEYVSRNPYYVQQYLNDINNVLHNHVQSILEQVIRICDNIIEDGEINLQEIKTIKGTCNEYLETPEDVPF